MLVNVQVSVVNDNVNQSAFLEDFKKAIRSQKLKVDKVKERNLMLLGLLLFDWKEGKYFGGIG